MIATTGNVPAFYAQLQRCRGQAPQSRSRVAAQAIVRALGDHPGEGDVAVPTTISAPATLAVRDCLARSGYLVYN